MAVAVLLLLLLCAPIPCRRMVGVVVVHLAVRAVGVRVPKVTRGGSMFNIAPRSSHDIMVVLVVVCMRIL